MSKRFTVRARGLALAALAAGATGAGLVSAPDPDTAAAAAPAVSMAGTTPSKANYGETLGFAGRVASGAGKSVALEHARVGGSFAPVARTTTTADGSYRFAVKARRSGTYRTVSQGAATAPRRVTVVASLVAKSRRHLLGGHAGTVRGRLLPATAGRRVAVQVRTAGRWKTVRRTATHAGGRFRAAFRPDRPGRYRVRVKTAGTRAAAGTSSASWRINAYRPAAASWYGPGLYGNKLGCGGTLSARTVGVANKHLPCGTRVTFRYRGRSVTAPVVDRGPYVGGREWDLTPGLKARLGFPSTGTVWATR